MTRKNLNRIVLMIVVGLYPIFAAFGQNINFVNYNEAQMMYNPAMLSSVNRSQVYLNYRNNKLTNEVSNFSSHFGLQVPLGNFAKTLNLGTIGISAYDERSNYALSLKNTGVAVAYSQPVKLSSNSFLSIGLQCNIYQKSLDFSSFSTGSQWNNDLGFDPTMANGEEQFKERFNQYTLNTGIYWQKNNHNGKTRMFGGLSLYNMNRPEESFTGKGNRKKWRYFANGGYVLADNYIGRVVLDAACMVQDKQNTLGLGLRAGMYYGSQNSGNGELAVLARYYTNNTIMVGAAFEQSIFTVGVSYDFLTAQSFGTNNRSSAVEVFAKVSFGRSGKKKIQQTPGSSNYSPGQKRVFVEERTTEVVESFEPDSTILKKVETMSDTAHKKYEPIRIALKRDFKFSFNDAVLNEEAKTYLDELTALMKRNTNVTLEIIGHTDDVGSKEGNQIISEKRAQMVADYLENKGIDKKRLTVTGKRDSEPLFPNTTPENRARNRRVEFIILN